MDRDHVQGLKPLVDAGFVFDEIWESGHRLSEKDAKENPAYEDYLSVIEEYEEKGSEEADVREWKVARGLPRVDVYCLGPSKHLNAADADDTSRNAIQNQCVILGIPPATAGYPLSSRLATFPG